MQWFVSNPIIDLFTTIAPHYDAMNDAMSLGLHRLWKRAWVHGLPWKVFPHSFTALDGASGTGDIALLLQEISGMHKKDLQLSCLEPSPFMYKKGIERVPGAIWVQGVMESLPFPDASFDLYTLSFGLRNAWDLPQAFQEAKRIVKKGGIFAILEFVPHAENIWMDRGYQAWLNTVIPFLGHTVAGNKEAYAYLSHSIQGFLPPWELSKHLQDRGFEDICATYLMPGIVTSILAHNP